MFSGVNWTKRHLEAYVPPGYPWGRSLKPLKLLSNLTRDVAGDVGLSSHKAVTTGYLGPANVGSHQAGHGPVPGGALVTMASDRKRLMIKIPENSIRRLRRGHGAVDGVRGAHIEIH